MRLNALGSDQSVQIYAAGQGAALIVAAVPVHPVDPRLLRPLVQDRHPLPGQGEHLHSGRTGAQQKPGDDGFAVEGVGGVLLQLRTVGQSDHLPGQGHQLAPGRLSEVVGEEEEVAEVDGAAAVEVEAWVAAAEGVCEEEEVGEAGLAVAVEVGRGLGGGGEGDGVEAGHRCGDGAGPRLASQGQGAGGAAVLIGGGGGCRESPFAGGDREGYGGPGKCGPCLIEHRNH